MPAASIKEWRARIGSSWCAIGRMVHKRPRYCPSGGTVQLSQHHFLSVTAMLTLLVWVSIALKELKINGYDPLPYVQAATASK